MSPSGPSPARSQAGPLRFLVLVAFLVAATPLLTPRPLPETAAPAELPVPGVSSLPPLTGLAFPPDGLREVAAWLPPIHAERAYPRVTLDKPLEVAAFEGSLLVIEQDGRVVAFPDQADAAATTVLIDLRQRVSRSYLEEGLLGLALPPDASARRELYLYYSANPPRRSVLSRLRLAQDRLAIDPKSERVLLEIPQPAPLHNGGGIAFGPDGMLYVGVGDGGLTSHDPEGYAQSLSSLLGSLLRIDPRAPSGPYAVPTDNPFTGRAGARPEVWAKGLRNPWRFCFREGTGEVWVGDVGLRDREEISRVTAGSNQGWPQWEGTRRTPAPTSSAQPRPARPVLDYPHSEGASVIGGRFYRGAAVPALRGAYVFGDHVTGRVWALRQDPGHPPERTAIARVPQVVSFAEDARGELLIVSRSGSIWRLELSPSKPAEPFPRRLSETGLFEDLLSLRPNPGLLPYAPRVPAWLGELRARRWVGVPQGAGQIAFHGTEPWGFPKGTVLVQHLQERERHIETRVLVREGRGWGAYRYVWEASGEEAILTAADDCRRCHSQAAGTVLGVETRQLNGDLAYPARSANQLRTWNSLRLLRPRIGSPNAFKSFPSTVDARMSLEARARAYLHVNCAPCHVPGGSAPVALDLRFDVGLEDTGLLKNAAAPLGASTRLLTPGEPEASVLWQRMRRVDGLRMPPTVGAADEAGARLIGDWIRQLR